MSSPSLYVSPQKSAVVAAKSENVPNTPPPPPALASLAMKNSLSAAFGLAAGIGGVNVGV